MTVMAARKYNARHTGTAQNGINVRPFRKFITMPAPLKRDRMMRNHAEAAGVLMVVTKSAMNPFAQNPFFRGLTREQLDLILPLFAPFSAAGGVTIFRQGEEASHLYLIENGSVTIQYKPYDGPVITLSHLRAGDIFGWSSVVGAHTYTSDAITTTAVDALRLRGSDLVQLCREHPAAGYAVLDKLAEVVSPRWTYARQQVRAVLENHTQPDQSRMAP